MIELSNTDALYSVILRSARRARLEGCTAAQVGEADLLAIDKCPISGKPEIGWPSPFETAALRAASSG